jgi:hypothetical protein
MSQISPPIRIVLVCAVALLVAWMLFLRPKADDGTPVAATATPAATATTPPVSAGGTEAGSAPGKAVEQANNAAATTPSVTPVTPVTPVAPVEETPSVEPGRLTDEAAAAGGLPLRVLHALADHKVVVLLFWSPKGAEDRSVRRSLTGIDRHDGKVLAHATHIRKIAAYGQITRAADVEQSPTVVVVDRDRKVETLVGYVDRVTIDQAVTDALRNS